MEKNKIVRSLQSNRRNGKTRNCFPGQTGIYLGIVLGIF